MLTILCIMILAYTMLGKRIEPLLERVKNIDWRRKIDDLKDTVRDYSLRVGRIAAKPLLQLWYVLNDAETTTSEKVLIYGAIAYIVMPVSIIPRRLYGLLGIMDEGAALIYVYKKIKSKITPEINDKVEDTLDRWFPDPKYGRVIILE